MKWEDKNVNKKIKMKWEDKNVNDNIKIEMRK